MIKANKRLLLVIIPLAYFFMVWFFPWHMMETNSNISIIYLFDISFVVVVSLILKKVPVVKLKDLRRYVIVCLLTIPIAAVIIWLNNLLKIETPFALVNNPALQLLLMAPLIEELVFRHAFFSLGQSLKLPKVLEVHYNSALFAISHMASIWVLPPKYYGFIAYQVIYTFFLGRICTKVLLRQESILAPIGVHFVFNLVFYFAVTNNLIF